MLKGIFNQPYEFAIEFDEAGLKVPLLRESVLTQKNNGTKNIFIQGSYSQTNFQQEQNLSITEPYLSPGIVAT